MVFAGINTLAVYPALNLIKRKPDMVVIYDGILYKMLHTVADVSRWPALKCCTPASWCSSWATRPTLPDAAALLQKEAKAPVLGANLPRNKTGPIRPLRQFPDLVALPELGRRPQPLEEDSPPWEKC